MAQTLASMLAGPIIPIAKLSGLRVTESAVRIVRVRGGWNATLGLPSLQANRRLGLPSTPHKTSDDDCNSRPSLAA